MRVLVLSHPYTSAYGGGERYLEALIEGLKPRGFEFELVSSSAPLLNIFQRNNFIARRLPIGPEPVSKWALPIFILLSPILLVLMSIVLFQSRHSGFRTAVCLSLTDKLLATLPARLLKIRVIWIEHLVPGRSLALNPLRPFYVAFSRLATVVTVSQAVVDGLARLGVPKNQIKIIAPGVTLPKDTAKPISKAVGIVARLAPEKNIALAIRAFERIAAELPEARLDIFGDGPDRENLEKLAEQLGVADRIDWHGHIENSRDIYERLSVLVVPSKAESFGLAALEAMSWGVPIIATKVGGLPELVKDGVTGLLISSDDEMGLANALLKVLRDDNLAVRLSAAGRIEAEKHTLQHNLLAWEKLLNA